jgi:integration host factor subunit alpha
MDNPKFCLTKADIADSVYTVLHIDKQKASQIIEDYIELIKEGLESEGKALLSGFGTFVVMNKEARRGRNPQTGDPLILRARKVVKFRASQLLRKAINSESTDDIDLNDDEMEEDE